MHVKQASEGSQTDTRFTCANGRSYCIGHFQYKSQTILRIRATVLILTSIQPAINKLLK